MLRFFKSFLKKIIGLFFTPTEIRLAYIKFAHNKHLKLNCKITFLCFIFRCINVFYSIGKLKRRFRHNDVVGYNLQSLHAETYNIFDPFNVIIRKGEIRRINIFTPAFSTETIAAGFFGICAFAKFLVSEGYNVRLVLFETFHYDEADFKEKIKKYPGIDDLYEVVEVQYIGRDGILNISDKDICVATVWYSAYFAEQVRKHTQAKHFMYLVQDYEPIFYPNGSHSTFVRNSYDFPNKPWFSTEPLKKYFLQSGMYSGSEWKDYCFYNNACSRAKLNKEIFLKNKNSKLKKFVFYCRPSVDRNLFHMGAIAIIKAFKQGLFSNGSNWEFYGMGIGQVEIHLDKRHKLIQLPWMSLEEYQETINSFDLGLSLMASPHPSLPPFDLAASGAIVITNSYSTKDEQYFSNISKNIICSSLTIDDLLKSIDAGVKRIDKLNSRFEASNINFPISWQECWSDKHRKYLSHIVSTAYDDEL